MYHTMCTSSVYMYVICYDDLVRVYLVRASSARRSACKLVVHNLYCLIVHDPRRDHRHSVYAHNPRRDNHVMRSRSQTRILNRSRT